MSNTLYLILGSVLVLGILLGIILMSKVKSARVGNMIGGICLLAIIVLTIINSKLLADWRSWASLAVGSLIGAFAASRVKMIQMPQTVALLNGLGGAASALVAIVTLMDVNISAFTMYTSQLALAVGGVTLSGSLIAAGKLAKILPQKPTVLRGHSAITAIVLIGTIASMVFSGSIWWITAVLSLLFGVVFAMRVGGADMPITISLLNSLSGVAGGIAGIALGDPVLIAVGGIVGASGLLLTQIMCRAMNRRLIFILLGKTAAVAPKKAEPAKAEEPVIDEAPAVAVPEETVSRPEKLLADAKDVIIVPGYGMALSQAQQHVRRLADTFEQRGARVRYAIHPVAGRMPGHMNVLLCEADVPYEQLFEMDDINADFASCDLAIAIGANDTINPAANTAEGTPIYGMPVLDIGDAKNIFVLNFDDKPGYAGVPNPLYTREDVVFMMGDAKESINKLLDMLTKPAVETVETAAPAAEETGANPAKLLANAKDVIIVPGYGMALSQAQQNVKSLADAFEQKGARVRYAIHPVAGRMPGHMNVLLCEADVPYEQLFEMDDINADFASCDLAIAIGANDTINPAANTAEGTPIYGMPVLDIGNAKNIFVLNFDDKPGYAGVPNPLYTREDVVFMMGDAKDSINKLMDMMRSAPEEKEEAATKAEEAVDTATLLANAKDVIIVPGYGMALSQAQQNVRRLADAFEQKGAKVRYAIHPVAGRMPGHMNVLLCEADVPYEQLFEMDDINADFNTCDLAIAIGANDTINPAANTAEGTPIYGMPVLDVGAAKNIIILNFDDKPGYAGVPNPLYSRKDVVFMMGDAKDNIAKLLDLLR